MEYAIAAAIPAVLAVAAWWDVQRRKGSSVAHVQRIDALESGLKKLATAVGSMEKDLSAVAATRPKLSKFQRG